MTPSMIKKGNDSSSGYTTPTVDVNNVLKLSEGAAYITHNAIQLPITLSEIVWKKKYI